ncbi:MAG: ribonuclease III [Thermovibrio sp.]|nr:MAG: ribonuclease III [Thermovibrio sp.]
MSDSQKVRTLGEGKLVELERRLGYSFKDRNLLRRALIHRSFSFEKEVGENYEVLEFLGDAVIGLIVSEELIKRFPDKTEGELSQIRAFLVSEPSLAELARTIDLGEFLYLGKGERRSGGKTKSSILCDVFEAVFGALYLDASFEKAKEVFKEKFLDKLWQILDSAVTYKDFKSYLQEVTQRDFKVLPEYSLIRVEGPEHDKTFYVECRVRELKTEGTGKSKKSAEQSAAKEMLRALGVIGEKN